MSPAVTPRFAGLLCAVALLFAGSVMAQDSADGQLLFQTCLGCHGIDNYKNNYPTYKVPKLGGQHALYVVDALKAYRDGARPHATMHAQAASLSDEQMLAIGKHLEGQVEVVAGDGAGAPPQAATCTACHGANGVGAAPNFPTLAGQHKDYLRHALTAYKSQDRTNAIMAGFVATLSEEDIDALAAWYSRQPGLATAD